MDDRNQPSGRARGRARTRTVPGRGTESPPSPHERGVGDEAMHATAGTSRGAIVTPYGIMEDSKAQKKEEEDTSWTIIENSFDYVRTRREDMDSKKGCSGNEVQLISNYYELEIKPTFEMSLYAVKVEPEVEEPFILKQLLKSRAEILGNYILSGFKLFTITKLPPDMETLYAIRKDIPYTITLEYKRKVEQCEPLYIQFYNIIVREMQVKLGYELLGRHYFNPNGKKAYDSWRLELWPGFQNSIRQQEKAVMMNVESVWKVIQNESILDKMGKLRQEFGPGEQFERRCNEEFIGMLVLTKYNSKSYKIDRIDFTRTPKNTFERMVKVEGGPRQPESISFKDYFMQRYNENITNMGQPMLISEPTLRDRKRGQVNDVLLVPQLCFPCGLRDDMRSNFRLMKDLSECLHMPPPGKVGTMQNFIRNVVSNEEIVNTLKRWGVKFKSIQPVEVGGRMLPPEKIVLGANNEVFGNDQADWTASMRGLPMMTAASLIKWAMVVTSRDAQSTGNLVSTMQRVANPLRYQINPPEIFRINDPRPDSYRRGIQDVMNKFHGKVDMVFIILMNNSLDTYSAVKQECSVRWGIPSQCFLAKNLNNKGLMSICTKMVIQMNAKQGGVPWSVQNPMKSIMVLGYDVHHAGVGGGGSSVGAMTATTNPFMGQYYSTVNRLPADRQEVSTFVAGMFEDCLRSYGEKNRELPARIMMYRDGVGDGQLKDVCEAELTAFKEKIKIVYAERNLDLPKLTFVIVNKRINTRFFAVRGKSHENPKPGLVVDDTVTRPERYDFFLISQTARQGCVSPTYYNVIHDDSGLGPDKLQRFTYKLCHLYYNWSGTVSVPGPCQNAHKFALQVGTALKNRPHQNLGHLLHYL